MTDGMSPEEARRSAMMSLLTAGLDATTPRSVLVTALADARRHVASHQSRGDSLDGWLASETKLRGVRENAAVIALTEVADYRELVADRYRAAHPERAGELDGWLRQL